MMVCAVLVLLGVIRGAGAAWAVLGAPERG